MDAALGGPERGEAHLDQIRAGRSKATPFVLFASVNLTLLALAAAISLIVILIIWLL